MTEQEAIEYIKDKYKYCGNDCNGLYVEECKEAKDMAISALEEIQQYRALGTAEELKEAREKQTSIARTINDGKYFCPRCKYIMRYPGYCRNCGQHAY